MWRQDEQAGQSFALRLTAAGVRAIPIDDRSASDDTRGARTRAGWRGQFRNHPADCCRSSDNGSPRPSPPRGGTKLARLVELLQRDQGATITELAAATDWLPHTTRAALTGLRKRGYAVTINRSDKERGSAYRARLAETIDIGGTAAQSDYSPTISVTPKSKKAPRAEKHSQLTA